MSNNKYFTFVFALGFLFISSGCHEGSGNPIGSQDVLELDGAVFQIDSTYTSSSRFYVEGRITNQSTTTYHPHWYIEGEFFADENSNLIFGGSSTSFNYPLAPMNQTFFDLDFSSNNIIESEYPNFDVRNLRAYINN